MRWQIGLLGLVLAILLFAGGLFLGSYRYREEPIHSSASERLRPPRRIRLHLQTAHSCTYRCIRVCTSA